MGSAGPPSAPELPAPLETPRLIVRGFEGSDLAAIHAIFDAVYGREPHMDAAAALEDRKSWLTWSILSQTWLQRLHQPPYGERAVVEKATGALLGAVGYVPCLDVFEQIPELNAGGGRPAQDPPVSPAGRFNTPEVGLFWMIDPARQGRGYATEAAAALVEHAFRVLRLKRIIATTEHANQASQAVMRKLGMRLARNPLPEPAWLQVVGVLEHAEG